MKTEIIGFIVAGLLLFPRTGGTQEPNVKVPAQATVNGNYSNLLRIIKVPVDQKLVGDFCDLGYYPESQYRGYKDWRTRLLGVCRSQLVHLEEQQKALRARADD